MTDLYDALGIRRLLGSLAISMMALDLSGRVIGWNRHAAAMYGWAEDEALGRPVAELGMAVDPRVDSAAVMAQLRSGRPWEGEYRVGHRDGRQFTVHVVDSPLFDAAGTVTGFVGIAVDVSAERQGPIAVLDAVIGHSPTSVTVVGADNRIALTLGDEHTDYETKSSYVGRSIAELIPGSRMSDVMAAVNSGHGPVRQEVEYGGRTYDATAVALPDSVAGPGSTAVIATDITERVAEARRFRALVENLEEVTGILNADGSLRYVSPAIEQLSGYTPQEMTGASGWDSVHPDDLGATRETLQAVLERSGVLITQVFRARHRDGRWLDIEQSMVNRLDEPAVQGIVSVTRDVTEQRARERQLLALNRLHAVLSECGNVMVRADDPDTLRSEICRIVVNGGGFAAAAFTTLPCPPSGAVLLGHCHAPDSDPEADRLTAAMIDAVNATDWGATDVTCEGPEALMFSVATRESPPTALVICPAADVPLLTPHGLQMLHGLARDVAFSLDSISVARNRSEAMHLSARRAQQQAVVSRLGFMALGMADTGELLNAAVQSLSPFGIRQAILYEALAGGHEVLVRATFGDRVPVSRGEVIPRSLLPMTGSVLRSGEAVCVDDFSTDKRFEIPSSAEAAAFVSVGSGLSVPVQVGGATLAALTVHSFVANDFDSHEINFYDSLAHVISGAIERNSHENLVRHESMHDPLTKLPNYVLLVDRLEQALSRARRRQTRPVALLRADLDGFTLVNGAVGRSGGDSVLAAAGARLRGAVRPSDTVAHLGGGEFVVLCEDLTDAADAVTVSRRINACIREPFLVEGNEVNLTASIGIAVSGEEATVDGLLQDADVAMHRAKQMGRDRFEVFDDGLRQRLTRRVDVEQGLRGALDRDEFMVAYQPVIDLATGETREAEALLRWTRADGTPVSPADFIPVAEDTGMIVAIGEWVLRRACEDAVRWNSTFGRRRPVGVAVNLSARQVSHPDIVPTVVRTLEATGLSADLLRLEITETALMAEGTGGAETLQALDRLGVHLSVDDFGTGYSSLMYLRQYPVRVLKIDRYFVAGLGKNAADDAIVRAVIALAHSLSLSATAEGVETLDQLHRLRALGCDSAQGFLWSKAVPYVDFVALIESLRVSDGEPVERLATPIPLLKQLTPRGQGGLRVVLADDSDSDRGLLRMALEESGGFVVVGEATDGECAIALAAERQPELLILDMAMPGMSGLDSVRPIHDASPATRIVILSGYLSEGLAEAVTAAGAVACFDKSVPLENLIRHLGRLFPGQVLSVASRLAAV